MFFILRRRLKIKTSIPFLWLGLTPVQSQLCPVIFDYVQTRSCRVELPAVPYHPWAAWVECTATCAVGVMVRTAEHMCGEMLRLDTATCRAECYWQEWESWTGCSVICGARQMRRVRYDSCSSKYPKLKSLHVMVVQVCTVNGQTGLFAVKNVRAEFLVDSNITAVALNQSLKSELVTLIDCQTGHFGQNAVQPVPAPDPDNKLISVALIQSEYGSADGVSSRSRVHQCGLVPEEQFKTRGRIGYYGTWTAWSQCNDSNGDLVLCGGGLRRRNRNGFCGNLD